MEQPKNQNLRIERFDHRLIFAKKGRARYISHLDLMRTMQRSFKRAGVPIWCTQGFNPHAYLMFPLALPLGAESETEILDIALTERIDNDELVKKLNAAMPEGLYFIKSYEPQMKHTQICSAEYEIRITASGCTAQRLYQLFSEFYGGSSIEAQKRVKPKRGAKAGIKTIDIKPYVKLDKALVDGDSLLIVLTLPAGGTLNLNTSVLTDAFLNKYQLEAEEIYVKRTKILCENGELFT